MPRALTRAITHRETSEMRVSLARTALWLASVGETGDLRGHDFTADDAAPWVERTESAWGPFERVRCPGSVEGITPAWTIPPGPLGVDAPAW